MKRFLFVLLGFILLLIGTLSGNASAETITARPSSLQGWDFSQTRSAGHYAFDSTGLHIWTDDASSQAKVAGYIPEATSLSSVAAGPAPAIEWVGTSPAPGLQLVVNGGAILVGESIYGDKWWMSDFYCTTLGCDDLEVEWSGGGGSAHSATLVQWSAALEEANVSHFGFSLGSGVKGDGTIKSLTLGEKVYKFDKDVPPPVTTTTTTPPVTTTTSSTTPPETTSTTTTAGVSYENCDAVRTAGRAPLLSGQPGYRAALDGDADGVACEAVGGRVGSGVTPARYGKSSPDLAYTGTNGGRVGLLLAGGALALVGGVGAVLVARKRKAKKTSS